MHLWGDFVALAIIALGEKDRANRHIALLKRYGNCIDKIENALIGVVCCDIPEEIIGSYSDLARILNSAGLDLHCLGKLLFCGNNIRACNRAVF